MWKHEDEFREAATALSILLMRTDATLGPCEASRLAVNFTAASVKSIELQCSHLRPTSLASSDGTQPEILAPSPGTPLDEEK